MATVVSPAQWTGAESQFRKVPGVDPCARRGVSCCMNVDPNDPISMPGEGGRPAVVVASAGALPLRTAEVDHPSIPDGSVGIGTYVRGKLLGRQAVAPDSVMTYETLLSVERRLAYVAHETDDGSVEGQLAALIPPSEIVDQRDPLEAPEEEPWKASVPSFDVEYDATADGGEAADPNDDEHVALLPLGVVVRMAQRRNHPDDLASEAADVLRTVVNEGAVEIVDQFLDTI